MRVKKAANGTQQPKPSKKPVSKDSVESELFPGKMIPKSKSNYHNGNFDKMFKSSTPKKSVAPAKKAKYGNKVSKQSKKK